MNYKEAIEKIKEFQTMIGTTNERGFNVTDVIIVPSDNSIRNNFIRKHIVANDIESYEGLSNDDVEIWAIDGEFLKKSNILFFDVLAK